MLSLSHIISINFIFVPKLDANVGTSTAYVSLPLLHMLVSTSQAKHIYIKYTLEMAAICPYLCTPILASLDKESDKWLPFQVYN